MCNSWNVRGCGIDWWSAGSHAGLGLGLHVQFPANIALFLCVDSPSPLPCLSPPSPDIKACSKEAVNSVKWTLNGQLLDVSVKWDEGYVVSDSLAMFDSTPKRLCAEYGEWCCDGCCCPTHGSCQHTALLSCTAVHALQVAIDFTTKSNQTYAR